MIKTINRQAKRKKPTSEPDLDMMQILELPDRGFKITLVHVLSILMRKKKP